MKPALSTLASMGFPCTVLLAGLSCWLTCAVYNNIRDPGTNIHLLGLMFRMDLIREDPYVGNGLQHRARMRRNFAVWTLRVVIFAQVVIALLLWTATAAVVGRWLGTANRELAVGAANLAIAGFTGLWIAFLTGGLWFGYWMKMPQVQQVHFSLFTIALVAFALIDRLP